METKIDFAFQIITYQQIKLSKFSKHLHLNIKFYIMLCPPKNKLYVHI